MLITLEKAGVKMVISTLGAEPQSLVKDGIEYIWQGDKEYWFRRAPLLFPMSGPTKDDMIEAKGKMYKMPNNGFARDTEFIGEKLTDDIAQFTLTDSEKTRSENYPYKFTLRVTYTLHDDGYTARAEVEAEKTSTTPSPGIQPSASTSMARAPTLRPTASPSSRKSASTASTSRVAAMSGRRTSSSATR